MPVATSRSTPRGVTFIAAQSLLLGCPADVRKPALLLAEFLEQEVCQVLGDVFVAPAVAGDAVLLGEPAELHAALDLVGIGPTLGRQRQGVDDLPSMIGMSRRSTQQTSEQVPGDDGVGGCATNALVRVLAERINSAGLHGAVAAAYSELAEATLRFLRVEPIPGDGDSRVGRQVDHLLRCYVGRTRFRFEHGGFLS